jgi:hypothetical protein
MSSMLRYHITCGLEKKIASIDNSENLLATILALFSVSADTSYVLQVWNADFEDFVDVENPAALPDISKLKLLIKGTIIILDINVAHLSRLQLYLF